MKSFNGTGFFEEGKNNRSSMRLMCFLTLLFAFYITWLIVSSHLIAGTPIENTEMAIIALLFIAAFAPKAVQKFAENKFLEPDQLNKPSEEEK